MPTPATVVIAHPQELIRAGLRAMLADRRVRIVGESIDTQSTLAAVEKLEPAVVLLDAAMPGGDAFELVASLARRRPATTCVLVTVLDNPTYMARARAAGAADCLLHSVRQRELVAAVTSAARGKTAAGSGPFAAIAASMRSQDARAARDSGLTPRESQVLSHIAFGLSNDEIARSLEISVETVKEHVQNLLRKLAMHDRTQAAVWAVKVGVVGTES